MRWLALALVLAATPAAAQDPVRARGRLDGTTARLTLRYELQVNAGTWQSPAADLALPHEGLVTSARASFGGRTHGLALMRADAASNVFTGLTSDAASEESSKRAPTSAVMISGGAGRAQVALASARTGTLVLDLEVAVPTCYFREARYLGVPGSWSIAGATGPDYSTFDEPDALDKACGNPGEDTPQWVGFPSSTAAKRPARIATTADRVDVSDQSIARIELDLAPVLADVPRDLATVIVVDDSRSLSEVERAAQRELARAYLAKSPGSRVQVVAFARRATALLPAWQSGAAASRNVDAALAKLAPGNGSNFDAGLTEASTWLARVQGTKRIVLVTDERMAARLRATPPAQLARLVPAGTLLHVAVVSPHDVSPTRFDDAALAGLAEATEGMAVRFGRSEAAGAGDEPLDASILVRPLSLDHLTVASPGWTAWERDSSAPRCEDEISLDAGGACTWWGQAPRTAAQPVTITGRLWGKLVSFTLAPSTTRALDLARTLSTRAGVPSELRPQLDEQARAVNDVWSLLATWGGPGRYESYGGGTGWGATCSCDGPGTLGHGSIGAVRPRTPPPPQVPLADQLADKLAACNLGGEHVEVEVELTLDEIADVHATSRSPALAACVAEVVWASTPRIAEPRDHQVMRFVAGG